MGEPSEMDNATPEAEPRPVWMQVTFGLLMGAVAVVVLFILLSRMG